jgi:hypothetical protein
MIAPVRENLVQPEFRARKRKTTLTDRWLADYRVTRARQAVETELHTIP